MAACRDGGVAVVLKMQEVNSDHLNGLVGIKLKRLFFNCCCRDMTIRISLCRHSLRITSNTTLSF